MTASLFNHRTFSIKHILFFLVFSSSTSSFGQFAPGTVEIELRRDDGVFSPAIGYFVTEQWEVTGHVSISNKRVTTETHESSSNYYSRRAEKRTDKETNTTGHLGVGVRYNYLYKKPNRLIPFLESSLSVWGVSGNESFFSLLFGGGCRYMFSEHFGVTAYANLAWAYNKYDSEPIGGKRRDNSEETVAATIGLGVFALVF